MAIIAFVKAKGGVGCTTTAVNLAYLRGAEIGSENVILVDADSIHETASTWTGLRIHNPELPPILTVKKTGDRDFVQDIKMLHNKFQDVIIDVGAGNSSELLASMVAADKIYIPVRSSYIDTFAFYALDQKVGQAKASLNPNLQAFIYPCAVPTNFLVAGDDLEDVVGLANELQYIKLNSEYIYDRKAFRRSPKFQGKTIFELTGHGDPITGRVEEKKDAKGEQEMINFYKGVYYGTK